MRQSLAWGVAVVALAACAVAPGPGQAMQLTAFAGLQAADFSESLRPEPADPGNEHPQPGASDGTAQSDEATDPGKPLISKQQNCLSDGGPTPGIPGAC